MALGGGPKAARSGQPGSLEVQRAALERHGELVPGQDRHSHDARAELFTMSSATIDRHPDRPTQDQIWHPHQKQDRQLTRFRGHTA